MTRLRDLASTIRSMLISSSTTRRAAAPMRRRRSGSRSRPCHSMRLSTARVIPQIRLRCVARFLPANFTVCYRQWVLIRETQYCVPCLQVEYF